MLNFTSFCYYYVNVQRQNANLVVCKYLPCRGDANSPLWPRYLGNTQICSSSFAVIPSAISSGLSIHSPVCRLSGQRRRKPRSGGREQRRWDRFRTKRRYQTKGGGGLQMNSNRLNLVELKNKLRFRIFHYLPWGIHMMTETRAGGE